MRTDDVREACLPEPADSVAESTKRAAKVNAARVAKEVMVERRGRLRPPKFVHGEASDVLQNDASDPHSFLKLLDTFAVSDQDAAASLMHLLLRLEDGTAAEGKLSPTNGLLGLVHAIDPKDAQESMLASQMVGTHTLAMECLRRANVPGQTFEGRDVNLRHAERLMRIYAQQLDTLNKHRGKGQQKVTVEHVTVNEGGQAVVGAVER